MENLGDNLYIEPNLIYDDRKANVVSQNTANLACIDSNLRIIVQRIEKTSSGTRAIKDDVLQRLSSSPNPRLSEEVGSLMKIANSEINFSNFDKCYVMINNAIKRLEQ